MKLASSGAASVRLPCVVIQQQEIDVITADQIKPKEKGKSDFFSWQLYRWAKKRPEAMKIWSSTWNCVSGIDAEKTVLYIGFERDGDWIHARQLRNLCLHGSNLDCWAYGPCHDTRNWVDITDQFWERYFEIGVCAIHGDYAHNWSNGIDTRTCRYCGKTETKQIKPVTTEVWVAV